MPCRPPPNSAEQIPRASQYDARVADPPRDPDRIEMFQHLDRQIAADARTVLELHRREVALRRLISHRGGNFRHARDGLGQEETVRRNLRDPSEALNPL